MNKVIELKEVWKIYHVGEVEIKALRGLTLSVRKGEFLAILGKSGSGKSTCVNHIGCLDTPTKGEIFLDGQNIAHFGESHLANIRGKKIGFIFQSFNLIPNLTAKENVMLPMMFLGVSIKEREERAEELLELVDLKERMDHYPNQLSGGQMQRVAIARSLANKPEVILADEPTGNLDTKTGNVVMEFLEKLNKEGKTIIMVTHEPELAQNHADVVYWLLDGELDKVTKGRKKVYQRTKKTKSLGGE